MEESKAVIAVLKVNDNVTRKEQLDQVPTDDYCPRVVRGDRGTVAVYLATGLSHTQPETELVLLNIFIS